MVGLAALDPPYTWPATLMIFLALLAPSPAPAAEPRWQGVDETVIEKFAEEAGRPPRQPYINTEQGDLLLFLFLLAGATGGFIAGYTFRGLFPPKNRPDHAPPG
jgi:ABC-type cobalt transport system substrate-binding protein